MIGLFCGTTANTNEEYKKVIKGKMNIYILMGVIGLITVVVTLLSSYCKISIDEHMLSTYAGVGTGLIAASLVLWIKNKRLLSNEEKLKQNRINNADERNLEISNRAFRAATVVMLVAMYATALIGGLFYPMLVKALFTIVCLFLCAYLAAYRILSKRI